MSKNNSIIVLFLTFTFLFMVLSCSMLKDPEAEKLRKEVEELKKEKADLANQASNTNIVKAAPKKKISAPVGSTVAFCNASDVVVRKSPSLQARKVTSLRKGEKVFVIEESDNTDEWKGTEANWAYIQKENGQRGWVFTPFIGYDEDGG